MTDCWVQEELQLINVRFPQASVILLSDREDADEVAVALSFGVRGYIPTSTDCQVAFAALQLIYDGGSYVPAHVLKPATIAMVSASEDKPSSLVHESHLTPREFAVAHLLREGKPNKLIARILKIEESTVKVHVRSILKKLQVANRTQAASVFNSVLHLPAPTVLDTSR